MTPTAGSTPALIGAQGPTPAPGPAKPSNGEGVSSRTGQEAPQTVDLPRWVLDESCWGEGLASGKRHAQYDMGRDVVLRMEVISNTQTKFLTMLSLAFTILAVAALVSEAVLKFVKDPEEVLLTSSNKYFISALAMAATMLALLCFVLLHFTWRLAEALRSGRQWTRRRKHISLLAYAQLVVQTANTALWVAISIYLLSIDCGWDSDTVVALGWAQWTLWNTEFLLIIVQGHGGNVWRGGRFVNSSLLNCGRLPCWGPASQAGEEGAEGGEPAAPEDRLILDAPWSIHLLKLVPWVLLELVVSLMARNIHRIMHQRVRHDCENVKLTCEVNTKTQVYIALMTFGVGIYLIVYTWHMIGTFRQLATRPYSSSKLSNVLFRIQARQVATVFSALTLAVIMLLLVRLESCWSFVFTWFGVLPMHIATSSMCIILSWYFMPTNPSHHNQILQVWLQECAFTEASLPACLARRNRHLASSQKLAAKSMFCLETALKLLYWSCLVYDYEEVPGTPLDLGFALGLYQLDGAELVWDRGVDIKALVAWSRKERRVVIAFRGTASFENIKTDLRLWQTVHPPKRSRPVSSLWGLRRMQRTLMVHAGFWEAWAGAPKQAQQSALSQQQQQQLGLEQPPAQGSMGSPAGSQSLAARMSSESLAAGCEQGEQGSAWRLARLLRLNGGASRVSEAAPPLPYNQQLLRRVGEILEEQDMDAQGLDFYLTGHSLGGALASLAAQELKQRWPRASMAVYTFGAPRTGNRSFAAEYDSLITNHWGVICDQDPVPRVPKSTYKRCGSRVIVNARGDLIIRPTFLETAVLKGTGVVGDHLLERYRAAFAAVLKAQFTTKRLLDGQAGVEQLGRQVDLDQLLLCEGLDPASLRDPARAPVTLEALEKRRQAQERSIPARRHVSRLLRSAGSMCGCAAQLPPLPAGPANGGSGGQGGGRTGAMAALPEEGDEELVCRLPGLESPVAGAGSASPGAGAAGALVEMSPAEEAAAAGQQGGVMDKAAAAIRTQSLRVRQSLRRSAEGAV